MKKVYSCIIAWLCIIGIQRSGADVSRPGGAGHALLFRDYGVVIEPFNDLATDEFTFEAWLRTTDSCHRSAVFSYALPSSENADERQMTIDANHFVIFDPSNVIACHDFEYIDLWPDPGSISCYASFNYSESLPSFVSPRGDWHHLAVTWTSANNGLTKIYLDGLLRAETPSGKTSPLRAGGALMLGAEQDCYAGCSERGQGFYGEMDEVRIWRVARSQEDILKHMRDASGLENHQDLAAYWQFNDPEENGLYRSSIIARDVSGRGNDISLITLPTLSKKRVGRNLETGVVTFRGQHHAQNQNFQGMPQKDITIEFWARTPEYNSSYHPDEYNEFFSFATTFEDTSSRASRIFLDDAILIEKYTKEFKGTSWVEYQEISTAGTISIHINANREGMNKANDHWLDFHVNWLDPEWHHVAVSWKQSSGEISLYYDGKKQTPFWRSNAGEIEIRPASRGGVSSRIAAGTLRAGDGSLALGGKQETYGGEFSSQYSMHGDLASLRIWDRVLSEDEISAGMHSPPDKPPHKNGLVAAYDFDPSTLKIDTDKGFGVIKDSFGRENGVANDLYLSADAPQWVYSTAPLANPDGTPVAVPTPGSAGHAFRLSDQQVLIHKNFKDFPSEEITVEFWMRSTDSCNKGVPFSYATGGYSNNDNTFLVFDYTDWGVSVLEDEGVLGDHKSGIGAVDGRWKHIAVTWRSYDGQTNLYQNGKLVWTVTRSRGGKIPSGGTLVIGREQDCEGGCFDSAKGAAGNVQTEDALEYGTQDFFGLIDEMRVWKRARTAEQIQGSMQTRLTEKGRTGRSASGFDIDPKDPDLVAYWNFDEGSGYVIKDVTGRGHDLLATQPPQWEVVRYLAVCGNGVLEGLEECDDGNDKNGDGCSSKCQVENGYECTMTSPSRCWKRGDSPPEPAPGPSGSDDDDPGSDSGKSSRGDRRSDKSSSGHGWIGAVTGLLLIVTVCAVVWVQREAIFIRFPALEDAFDRFMDRLTDLVTRIRGRHQYTYAGELNIDENDIASPDFTRSVPAPGGRGPYEPLPGRAPQGP